MTSPDRPPARGDEYVVALDQGTSSTRCLVVDRSGAVVATDQAEHAQHFPRPGCVEHDPAELWANACSVIEGAMQRAGIGAGQVAAVGVTNQRETVVVWERATGRPIHHAVVWQDTRTESICAGLAALGGGVERYRSRTGLPLATYFAGPKIRWVLDHVPGARAAAARGDLLAGTVDTWLVWNLTGGTDGGVHVTDVTNASRTLLMDLPTLEWAPDIAAEMGVPLGLLPQIRSSSEQYGRSADSGPLPGVPVAGVLGDQQAALVGQCCFSPGDAKNTYGTGSFVLTNTGTEVVRSSHGLVTTVAYQLGGCEPVYALEGSIAATGSVVQWLRDNLGLIGTAAEVEELAGTVPDTGGAYVVPAFSGLLAPHWRSDARGTITGLTRYTTRAHLARACLEAAAYQSADVLAAMQADLGAPMTELRVDGGMAVNDLLLQVQADVLGLAVVRPAVTETTALGAAYAAGLAVGLWADTAVLQAQWQQDARFSPQRDDDWRRERLRWWHKAIERSLGWAEGADQEGTR